MVAKVAILHEGNAKKTSDNLLIKLLIEDLGLDLNKEKVEFFGFSSKTNFFKSEYSKYNYILEQVRDEGISKILFIVDADYVKPTEKYGGYENTFNALTKIIKDLKITDISDIYITCDPHTQSGYLESLILSTIPSQHKKCIDHFLGCSEFKSKQSHKSIVHYIYKMAYPKAPFNFSHSNFDELKGKLQNLLKN
jgi:hypothetical protein